MAVTRIRACLPNLVALVGLASALASFADAALIFRSMNAPSFGSRPSGQSMLAFARPRQSRAVVHAGMVVVVVPPAPGDVGVVVVVGPGAGGVVVVTGVGGA